MNIQSYALDEQSRLHLLAARGLLLDDLPLTGRREALAMQVFMALQFTRPLCVPASEIDTLTANQLNVLAADERYLLLSLEQCKELVRISTRLNSAPLTRVLREACAVRITQILDEASPVGEVALRSAEQRQRESTVGCQHRMSA